jgi:hypothetical protein
MLTYAVLLGAYMLLVEGLSAESALRSFDVMGPNIFRGFRDALPEGARGGGFRITLSDLLRGLRYSVYLLCWYKRTNSDT